MPGVSVLPTVYTVLRWRSFTSRNAFEIAWITGFPLYDSKCLGLHAPFHTLYPVYADISYVQLCAYAVFVSSIATIAYGCMWLVWYIIRNGYAAIFGGITACAASHAYSVVSF